MRNSRLVRHDFVVRGGSAAASRRICSGAIHRDEAKRHGKALYAESFIAGEPIRT